MSSALLLIGVCFLAELCIGQSITPAPSASCNYCFLAPGYTATSSSDEEYLLFTAYSMTSAFTQDGSCYTVSGAPTPLQTQYSVAKPAIATAKPAQYSSAVATWFVNFLNVPDWGTCGENGSLAVHLGDAEPTNVIEVAVPTGLGEVSRRPILSSSSSSSSSSSTATSMVSQSSFSTQASNGLSASAKAAIGVAVPVFVLALVLPGLILWARYRKRRIAMIERKFQEKMSTETEREI